MQKLSKRLQAVSDFVTNGNRVADIGTDHGYLPIALIQSGRCPGAIAMDIRPGPLARAREHIAANQLEMQIQARLSDGLQNLGPDDADSVVIAGMGGLTVIQILEAAADLLPHIKELILEPQSDPAKVRRFLREQHMYIDRENLVFEDGKYYPILHVVMNRPVQNRQPHLTDWQQPAQNRQPHLTDWQQPAQNKQPHPAGWQQVLDQYGECLISDRHPVLLMLLERDKKLKEEILHALEVSPKREKNAVRRQELEEQLAQIQMLQEYLRYDSSNGSAQNLRQRR